jgi:hypothetical protein
VPSSSATDAFNQAFPSEEDHPVMNDINDLVLRYVMFGVDVRVGREISPD